MKEKATARNHKQQQKKANLCTRTLPPLRTQNRCVIIQESRTDDTSAPMVATVYWLLAQVAPILVQTRS